MRRRNPDRAQLFVNFCNTHYRGQPRQLLKGLMAKDIERFLKHEKTLNFKDSYELFYEAYLRMKEEKGW